MPTYKTGDVVTSGVSAPQVPYEYQSLIDANPYRNAGYTVRPWQQFLSWLGFRTQADAWKENMAVQAQEYDSAILQKQYNEDYNDPQSQVARMRAAGLNPDLDPSSISSGEASPMPEDPSTPMQSTGQEGSFSEFMGNVFSAFESVIGFTNGIQGIVGKNLQNRLLASEYDSQFVENAVTMSDMFLPTSTHPQGIQNYDWRAEANRNLDDYASKHIRKKDRQKFHDAINQYWDSAIGSASSYEQMTEYMRQRKSNALEEGTNWSDIDFILQQITEPLAQNAEEIIRLRQEVEIANSKAQKALAGYQEKYNEALDPNLQAEAGNTTAEYQQQFNQSLNPEVQAGSQNVQASAQASQSKLDKILSDTQQQVVSRLVEASKKKGLRGMYARYMLNRALVRGALGMNPDTNPADTIVPHIIGGGF